MRITLGLGLRGPDISPDLDNRHLIIEGHEGQGRSWKFFLWVVGGGGGVVACRIMVSAPVLVPFLWTLDFGFETLDLDLELRFGTWIWDLNS